MLAAVMWAANASPASAQELGDFFNISYDPTVFSKTDINESESFRADISGRAACDKDFPLPVSKAKITSRVIARHTVSGFAAVLNPEYIIDIDPFPDREGDSIEITKTIPLQFPAGAPSGDYNVVGELIKAEVKAIFWIPVTAFLPGEQPMGTIAFTGTEPPPSPEPAAQEDPPSTPPSSPAPPAEPEPVPSDTIAAPAVAPEPEQIVPWWVGLVIFVAIAVTILNVAWFISQWLKKR